MNTAELGDHVQPLLRLIMVRFEQMEGVKNNRPLRSRLALYHRRKT